MGEEMVIMTDAQGKFQTLPVRQVQQNSTKNRKSRSNMRISRERRLNSTLDNYQQVPTRIVQTIIDQKGNP
jgi:hypothetical protein